MVDDPRRRPRSATPRHHAKPPESRSIWNYLLSSDDRIREEILEAERQARLGFDNETDRLAWLASEREVREHRRWRHFAWALIFGPALVVLVWILVSLVLASMAASSDG